MRKNRIYRCVSLLFSLFVLSNTFAQEVDLSEYPKPVNKSTMIAIGGINLYDTYLSPLEYKGTSIRVVNERMNRLSWFDNKIIKQQIIDLEVAYTENPAKTASEYWLMLNYRLGGHYECLKQGDFRLRIGGVWDASVGVLYNERNGNNPASARAFTNLNLSAMALYNWKGVTFRWQMDTPVIGMLFSPEYGQSYYEMTLGRSINTVNFASLHNQRALRNYITADISFGKFTIRTGYLGSYYQTKVQDLQTHTYSHSFVIGFVTESINLSGTKTRNRNHWDSCFY